MKARFLVNKYPLASIFTAALLMRLVLLLLVLLYGQDAGCFTFDSKGYWQLAESLARDNQYGRYFDGVWYNEFFRTPLYPAFLALFKVIGAPIGLLLCTQVLLSALTCTLIGNLSIELGFNKRIAIIAGLLAALDLTSILFSNFILTETLFTFLLTAGLLFFAMARNRQRLFNLFWSGVLLGLAILCRPAGSFVPVLLIPFLLVVRASLKTILPAVGVFLLSLFLILSPWLVRNYKLSGRLLLSTSMQELFFLCPTAHVYGSLHNLTLGKARLAIWDSMHAELGDGKINDPIQRMEFEGVFNRKMILQHPVAYVKEYLVGMIYFAFKPSGAYWDQQFRSNKEAQNSFADNELQVGKYGTFAKVMALVQLLQLCCLWALTMLGLYQLGKQKKHLLFLFLTCLLIYFACMVPGSSAEGRFRIPALAAISITAAFGLNGLIKKSSASEAENEFNEAG